MWDRAVDVRQMYSRSTAGSEMTRVTGVNITLCRMHIHSCMRAPVYYSCVHSCTYASCGRFCPRRLERMVTILFASSVKDTIPNHIHTGSRSFCSDSRYAPLASAGTAFIAERQAHSIKLRVLVVQTVHWSKRPTLVVQTVHWSKRPKALLTVPVATTKSRITDGDEPNGSIVRSFVRRLPSR